MLENKLNVAQLDTPIQKLENLSQDYGKTFISNAMTLQVQSYQGIRYVS